MNSSDHLNNFLNYLNNFAKVSDGLEQIITDNARCRTLSKEDVFIRKGAYDKMMGFLSEGLMRIYDIDKQGQHWNKALLTYQTMLLGNTQFRQPSIHYIDALTDCHIVELPILVTEEAMNNFPELREIREKIISKIYQMKSERESDLLLLNTKEQYLKLVNQLGTTMDNIPQYHIASYLGITAVQLSRIKASLAS